MKKKQIDNSRDIVEYTNYENAKNYYSYLQGFFVGSSAMHPCVLQGSGVGSSVMHPCGLHGSGVGSSQTCGLAVLRNTKSVLLGTDDLYNTGNCLKFVYQNPHLYDIII